MKKRDREETELGGLGGVSKAPKLSEGASAPSAAKDRIALLREQLAAAKKKNEAMYAVTGAFVVLKSSCKSGVILTVVFWRW